MSIEEILKLSSSFNEKDTELIKTNGVVFTDQIICNNIIDKLNPTINDIVCEPSVGKGAFVFSLLEKFRNNGETILDITNFVENNLYCYDINMDFINEFKKLLREYFIELGYNEDLDLYNIRCADFLIENLNYDIIMGNPPYVRIQNMDKNYLDLLKKDLKSITLGNIDLYYAFIEKSLKVSKRVGFIIPNSFIKTKSGKFIRQIIKENISYLYDYGLEKVWQDISTYTCILICGDKCDDLIYETNKGIIQKNKTELSDDIWLFGEKNSGDKILSELINYCSGSIATIKDDVFKIDTGFLKKGFKIEQGICKKVIKATRDREISDHKWIIYPYDMNSKILDENFIKTEYPNAYTYLLSRKDDLNTRDKGKVDKYDSWFSYGRRQGLLKERDGKRIMLPLTFLKSRGIHIIEIPLNEEVINISGILLDIKEDKFDEFIDAINSEDFYNYCEQNNKTLLDKANSDDVWLSLTTTSLKQFKIK